VNTTQTGTIITHFVGGVGDALTTNIPVILVITASLIGLGIVLRYVRKWIGRKA